MKTFEAATILELNIGQTAYGTNERAREANAEKGKQNNGVGGSLNIQTPEEIIGDFIPTTPVGDLRVTNQFS